MVTLGGASLYHGDCRDLLPLSADVIITDPPYAVDKSGQMIGQIATNYHEKGTHTRGYYDHSPEQFQALLEPAFAGMLKSVPKGASLVAFCGNRTFSQMVHIAERAGWQAMDILVFTGGGSFAKSKTTLMPRHELALWARKPGGTRAINPDRNIANLFDIPKTKGESDHPTTKPQTWMRRVVEVFSEPGDIVLDPFAGSGSTVVAALSMGRKSIGIEQDKDHCKIMFDRVKREI